MGVGGYRVLYIETYSRDIILIEDNNKSSYSLHFHSGISIIHFTQEFDLRVAEDRFYLIKDYKQETYLCNVLLSKQKYDEYDVGPLGVYIKKGNKFFIILVKE